MNTLEYDYSYGARGWSTLPVRPGQKVPLLPEWQLTNQVPFSFSEHEPMNIGVRLGSASGGLVDVDLDQPEAITVADAFLPATGSIFGRPSRPRSHRLYVASPVPRHVGYKDTTGVMLVEMRTDKAQTVFPPSRHPSGEAIAWHRYEQPALVSPQELDAATRMVAAATLLARAWPAPGSRHYATLALAGMLLRADWGEERVRELVAVVVEAAQDDDLKDRHKAVSSTVNRLRQGLEATGFPTLASIIGHGTASSVTEWLDLPAGLGRAPFTDAGNAERLVARHGQDLRYVTHYNEWYYWDERRWRRDEIGIVLQRAKLTARSISSESADHV